MPICEIHYPRGLLSAEEKSRIAERVSTLMLEAEGLPDNPVSRSICLLTLNEADNVYVGGKPSEQGKIVIKIFAFGDAYSFKLKTDIHARLTRIFCEEHAGSRALKGNNVWCLIVELGPNNFGVGGKPVSLEMTRTIAASCKA